MPGSERSVPGKLNVAVFAVLIVFAVFAVFGRSSHLGRAVTVSERSVVRELEAAAHAGCSCTFLSGRLYICQK